MEKDAYVLCRVFHKNNIGPPNGQRYAPFIEEEWDDDASGLVPGVEPVGDGSVARHARVEGNGVSCSEGRNDVVQVCSLPSLFVLVVSLSSIISLVDSLKNIFIDALHLIYA